MASDKKLEETSINIKEDACSSAINTLSAHGPDSFPSSQDSTATQTTTIEPTSSISRKRALDLDEAEDAGLSPRAEDDMMEAVSTHLRPLAQPKPRKRATPKSSSSVTHVAGDGDFGEADFLATENWNHLIRIEENM